MVHNRENHYFRFPWVILEIKLLSLQSVFTENTLLFNCYTNSYLIWIYSSQIR